VGHGIADLSFQGLMPSFQFRKMRFNGHMQRLLDRIAARLGYTTPDRLKVDADKLWASRKIPAPQAVAHPVQLEGQNQKRHNYHCFGNGARTLALVT
jgi:hypothetical protein